jgi:pseudouridine-5'-phosphate glycosidase
MHPAIELHPEVESAIAAGGPVVALESTIIAHGMPYPTNVETALELERIVRAEGAVPATIAVLSGKIHVGLYREQIEELGTSHTVTKLSRRDLAYALTKKLDGATTVSATMICAKLAGLRVFATGGIGGVHREGETSWDVSADLRELASTEVAVVCAGAKAILDLGRTLEYLETQGVPVVGVGTDEFPAFYTRTSGFKLELQIDSPEQGAELMYQHWSLGLGSGLLFANPIPTSDALDVAGIDEAIDDSIAQARAQGIKGKRVTPFLLARLAERTAGKSLLANVALVRNNALLAARLARSYSKLKLERTGSGSR